MSKPRAEGLVRTNLFDSLPAPVEGLDLVSAIASMPPTRALVAENVICFPDRVETRLGAAQHVTGFAKPVKGLWDYNGLSASTLWATTDDGIFNATSAGAVGAAAIALTNGQTVAGTIATGAGNYMFVANGVDTIKQYDGTTWSSVAAFGGLTSSNIIGIEVYRQRLWFIEKNTMNLWYLAVNSISGAGTSYNLGAIFRRGGALQAMATWTIDGGAGPDDHIAIVSTMGECAVFTGTDPSSLSTWTLKGVYYIGKPVGRTCLLKFGGDLLYLAENGLYPLSRALVTASVDRSAAISHRISQLFADSVVLYGVNSGWQMVLLPDVPILLVNIPGTATGTQFVMHSQSQAWSTFSGWSANCVARMGSQLYMGGSSSVYKALTGSSDFGANIVSTCMSAFSRLRSPRMKSVRQVRPTFRSNGAFTYTLGIADDFNLTPFTNTVAGQSSAALWGTGVWGSSVWSSSNLLTREWRTIPDVNGVYKALYWQISSKSAKVSLLSTDYLYAPQGTF